MRDEYFDLGFVGDTEFKTVKIDLSDFFGMQHGEYKLLHQRSYDNEPYEVSNIETDSKFLYWTMTSEDIAYEGIGRAQIVLQGTNFLAKSRLYMTYVNPPKEG